MTTIKGTFTIDLPDDLTNSIRQILDDSRDEMRVFIEETVETEMINETARAQAIRFSEHHSDIGAPFDESVYQGHGTVSDVKGFRVGNGSISDQGPGQTLNKDLSDSLDAFRSGGESLPKTAFVPATLDNVMDGTYAPETRPQTFDEALAAYPKVNMYLPGGWVHLSAFAYLFGVTQNTARRWIRDGEFDDMQPSHLTMPYCKSLGATWFRIGHVAKWWYEFKETGILPIGRKKSCKN